MAQYYSTKPKSHTNTKSIKYMIYNSKKMPYIKKNWKQWKTYTSRSWCRSWSWNWSCHIYEIFKIQKIAQHLKPWDKNWTEQNNITNCFDKIVSRIQTKQSYYQHINPNHYISMRCEIGNSIHTERSPKTKDLHIQKLK